MTTTDLATFTATVRAMIRQNELTRLVAAWGSQVPAQRGTS